MTDPVTPIETGAIAGAIYALARTLEAFMKQLISLFKKKSADDRAARVEARHENAERDQWTTINGLRDDLAQHRTDDAQSFAALETKVDRLIGDTAEMSKDIKTVLRRSTDQVKK